MRGRGRVGWVEVGPRGGWVDGVCEGTPSCSRATLGQPGHASTGTRALTAPAARVQGQAKLKGYLRTINIAQADSCSSAPCGLKAVCQLLPGTFDAHRCICKSVYDGQADAAGEGCTTREFSCQSCADRALPFLPGSDAVCLNPRQGVECMPRMSYEEAEATCVRMGGRLCGLGELASDGPLRPAAAACKLDQERVWSSEACETGHYTQVGPAPCLVPT